MASARTRRPWQRESEGGGRGRREERRGERRGGETKRRMRGRLMPILLGWAAAPCCLSFGSHIHSANTVRTRCPSLPQGYYGGTVVSVRVGGWKWIVVAGGEVSGILKYMRCEHLGFEVAQRLEPAQPKGIDPKAFNSGWAREGSVIRSRLQSLDMP